MYVIGNNYHGEFGLNHRKDVNILSKHKKAGIKTIFCGNGYNIYVDNSDNYWCAGYHLFGQCGVGKTNEKNISSLTEIRYFKKNNIKIKKVCVSVDGSCTLWITDKYELYINGKNDYYQLGIGNNGKHEYEPILINEVENVIDGASRDNVSMVLCSLNINMIIMHWSRQNVNKIIMIPDDVMNLIHTFYGNTNFVYLTSRRYHQWRRIEKLKDKKIMKIASGALHSLFLECNGSVWCCGENKNGELGLSHYYDTYKYTEISYFMNKNIKIKDIKCGMHHNLAVDINNKVYSWGSNQYGQCGEIRDIQYGEIININTPTLLNTFQDNEVKTIKCGKYHSYVCTMDDEHYVFGLNQYGECINNNNRITNEPYLINNEINGQISSVYLGDRTTILLVNH